MNYDNNVPHIIKYMGSKRQILDFVIEGLSECYTGGVVCDLFAGSSILSGALRNEVPMISNDIQQFSAILANTYLSSYQWSNFSGIINNITNKAAEYVEQFKNAYPELVFNYNAPLTLIEFNKLENAQKSLINKEFPNFSHHLFVKNYSGTYWSYEQCLWIDAIKAAAEMYLNSPEYYTVISSLMFAMSYCSQSTGHYAQYRDANTQSSMDDIISYRQRDILPYFTKKFEELQSFLGENQLNHSVLTMDFSECLDNIPSNCTIYADPPYCFVHYSRFYHAIETLVRYDYPEVKFKGRYRTDRHQSPFCIRTEVEDAFNTMFYKTTAHKSNLVLSYSNTGMISLEKLQEIAHHQLGNNYNIEIRYQGHQHSTMGRKEDKSRNVQEALLLAKRRV